MFWEGGAGDLEAGGVDGGHEQSAFGSHVVIRQSEGLLHDLGHHWGRRPVAQHFLDHLPSVGHSVQHVSRYLRLQVGPHLCLLLPHLQARSSPFKPTPSLSRCALQNGIVRSLRQ